MVDDENVRQLQEGMRLIGEFAKQLAREQPLGNVDVRWSYHGDLRDGPDCYTLTINAGERTQDAVFPREPIEDYPGQVGVGKTEAVVKEAIRRLRGAR